MTWPTNRPTTTQRGYGNEHQQLRRQWAKLISTNPVPCARGCGHFIQPHERWHLDHSDDRTTYLGPSCERCNLAAAGRAGQASRPKIKRSAGEKLGRINPS